MDGQLMQLLLDAIHDKCNVFMTGLNQQKSELIAAVASNQIRAPGGFK